MIIRDTKHYNLDVEADADNRPESSTEPKRPWMRLLAIRINDRGETTSNCIRLSPEDQDTIINMIDTARREANQPLDGAGRKLL